MKKLKWHECRSLTELEQKFKDEADAGGFNFGWDDDGTVWALGSYKTGNLFSMITIEEHDSYSGGSIYFIDYDRN